MTGSAPSLASGFAPLAFALAAVLGLAVGSFLNVVIWRVPEGKSVVSPPSACPACGHAIRWYDNIPVISWIVLRAKCRDCGAPISVRYPLVELGTGVLFVLVVWRFFFTWAIPAFLWLAAIGVALALIDFDHRTLPDFIVLPSMAVVAALLLLASLNPGGHGQWNGALRAAIGALGLSAFYFILWWFGGMGWGDVKLAVILGMAMAWVGWGTLAVGAFMAFLVGGVVGLALMIAKRAGRKTMVPFGPSMIVGAACGVAWGEPLWSAYVGTWS